jgi:formylglycine-generating enzyme required for sulfatase activity
MLNTLHSTLDTLYDPASPFRPREGLYLGKTPIPPFRIPMGSYLLIIAKSDDRESVKGEGSRLEPPAAGSSPPHPPTLPPSTLHPGEPDRFEPVRMPFRVGRLEAKAVSATLYPEGSFPPGFRLVTGGSFPFQGEKNNPNCGVAQVLETEDVLLASFPVTCEQYLEFLNELAASDPAGAAARVPRESDYAGFYWPFVEQEKAGSVECSVSSVENGCPSAPVLDTPHSTLNTSRGFSPRGRYAIPTAAWLSKVGPELRRKARRLLNATADWEGGWPVAGVSWEDAACFAARRSRRERFLFGLPLEAEWEKAARGADGRVFPWGDHMDGTFCNMNKSRENAMHPVPVDSYPLDESPFGVRGLAGNVATPCLDGPGRLYPQWRYFRGGSYGDAGLGLHATSRRSRTPDAVYHLVGIRLCARLRVGGAPKGCAQELSLSLAHRRGETR